MMLGKKTPRPSTYGNALFLVLVAVALFAALSYAITLSGRGARTMGKETAILAGAQAAQYAGLMERTITRLRISSGCTASTISFENNVVAGYENASAPADKSCHVFDPAGGGMTFLKPPPSVGEGVDYSFTVDTSPDEISMILPINDDLLCRQINKELGINNIISVDDFVNATPILFQACMTWPAGDPSPAATYMFFSYLLF